MRLNRETLQTKVLLHPSVSTNLEGLGPRYYLTKLLRAGTLRPVEVMSEDWGKVSEAILP